MKVSTASMLGLVLLAAACGPSKEQERQDRIQRICNGLVGKTVREGANDLGSPYEPYGACRTDWTKLSDADTCPYDPSTSFCTVGWNYYANDPNACGPNGCYYACVVRVAQTDWQTKDVDAPICGSRFIQNQPYQILR